MARLVIVGCAIVFYRIGKIEYRKGFLMATISTFISIAAFDALGWSVTGVLLAQLGLFLILTIINVFRGTMQ